MDQALALKELISHLLIRIELNVRDRLDMFLVLTVKRELILIFHHFVLLLLIGNLLELLYELMKAFQLRLNILLACSTFFVFAALLWILTDAERFADLIARS